MVLHLIRKGIIEHGQKSGQKTERKNQKVLTREKYSFIIQNNSIHQTVDAEITAMMPLQRACDAESQVRNKLSNGPLRVQSKETEVSEYSVTCGHTSVAGDM